MADILAAYETNRDISHSAAIHGHSSFSKVFPKEGQLLVKKGIYMESQITEVDDLWAS
jgi:hypothetical protein